MKNFKMKLELGSVEYCKKYFRLLCIITPLELGNKELDIMSSYLSKGVIPLTSGLRKDIMKDLKMSEGNFSTYCKSLISKGWLKKNVLGDVEINISVLPDLKNQRFEIDLLCLD